MVTAGRGRRKLRQPTVHVILLVLGGAGVLGVVATAEALLASRFEGWKGTAIGLPIRDGLLVASFDRAQNQHLSYTPPEMAETERDRFLQGRSDVTVIVPWDMAVEDLLNLGTAAFTWQLE